MVNIKLDDWDENRIEDKVVNKLVDKLIAGGYSWSDDKSERITPFNNFRNQVANLVADKIAQLIINDEVLDNRIDLALKRSLDIRVNQIVTQNIQSNNINKNLSISNKRISEDMKNIVTIKDGKSPGMYYGDKLLIMLRESKTPEKYSVTTVIEDKYYIIADIISLSEAEEMISKLIGVDKDVSLTTFRDLQDKAYEIMCRFFNKNL